MPGWNICQRLEQTPATWGSPQVTPSSLGISSPAKMTIPDFIFLLRKKMGEGKEEKIGEKKKNNV